MIVENLDTLTAENFERLTGWAIKPQGACKDVRCVPLPQGPFDVHAVAERLGMAVVRDDTTGLWAIGPESGGRALATADAPEIVLPDRNGSLFRVSSLRGRKVLLLAWASW